MGTLTREPREFVDSNPVGVLAMLAPDGRPRQSLVYFAREGDRLLIWTLGDRFKARDTRRTGWASLCVMGHEPPYPSATVLRTRRDPHRERRPSDRGDRPAHHPHRGASRPAE